MLQTHSLTGNPFAMLTNPESVLAAIEKSPALAQLARRTCRPLDRPLLGGRDEGSLAADVDADIDADDDIDLEDDALSASA